MAKKKEITIRSSAAEYLSYVASVGDQPISVELRYEDENFWLTQEATIRIFRIVQKEGERHVNRNRQIVA